MGYAIADEEFEDLVYPDINQFSYIFIDTIGTWLPGHHDGYESFCKERDCLTIRDGFEDFVKYYYEKGKKIYIHSDGFKADELVDVIRHIGLEDYVTGYIGNDTENFIVHENKRKYKNFSYLAEEFRTTINDCVDVADGQGDIAGVEMSGISMVHLPNYLPDFHHVPGFYFDFRSLIN